MTEEAAGGEVVRVGEAMGGAAEHLEQVVGAVDSAAVSAVLDTELGIQCAFAGQQRRLAADAVLLVTSRLPEDSLFPFQDLLTRHEEWTDQGLRTVQAIGDALAPSTIAAAVWEGRRYAKELEAPTDNSDTTPYHREIAALPQ